MAKLKETKQADVDVVRKGTQIVMPPGMTYEEGCEWMQRKAKEEETKVGIYHDMPCAPLDGLVAFQKAMSKIFGWVGLIPTPGFFGSTPPHQITVKVGPAASDTIQAPYGRIQIPGVDGYLETGFSLGGNIPSFQLTGEVKRKSEHVVKNIVAEMERILKEESIYKGKAWKISFNWADEESNEQYDIMKSSPQFMDEPTMKEEELIFSQEVMHGLKIGLFTPIEQTEACRRYKVPLKRGVLLHGPYGTGKTLTATVTAEKAVANGWTFIYLDSVRDLQHGLKMAAKYAPAVLFAEDIDRVMEGNRSLSMDAILNTLDGVDTKGAEIITVLTTNHVDKINPTLLRMGRLDSLIHVTPPDAEAAIKLVKLYGRNLLEKGIDLKKVGKMLEGKIPAFIREVTERAKIGAISRLGNVDITGQVKEADLIAAADALEPHAAMLAPKENDEVVIPFKDLSATVSKTKLKRLNG